MPKTKEQKQKEANERYLKHKEMKRHQIGGDIYFSNLLNGGVHAANQNSREAYKIFKNGGNPTEELTEKPQPL